MHFHEWLKDLAKQVERGEVVPTMDGFGEAEGAMAAAKFIADLKGIADAKTPPTPERQLWLYLLYMDPQNFIYVVSPLDFDSYVAHVRLGGGSYSPDGWVNLQHIHYIKNCGPYKPLEQAPLPENVVQFGKASK